MIIEITQEDLDKGCRSAASYCPIARAAKRVTGFNCQVTGLHIVIWYCGHMSDTVQLPDSAAEFVRLFDQGKPVQPFSFDLNYNLEENN